MRISVAAAGNAEKNINIINARFQAEALRQLRGIDTGVLINSFYTADHPRGDQRTQNNDFIWKLTASTVSDIAVGRGMATAYGFDIQSEETVHLSAVAPSAGTKYLFVYLEWDFSNPEEASGKIDIRDNGSSSSWTPSRQDNLITNPLGTYQLILYRLQVNTAGRITATASWKDIGVPSIECPLFAKYCERASNTDYADYATGRTDKTLKQHLDEIYQRLNDMGFKTGTISGNNQYGSVSSSSLRKYGKIALLDATIVISGGSDVRGGFKIDDPTFYPKAAVQFYAKEVGGTSTPVVTLGTDGTTNNFGQTNIWGNASTYTIANVGWEIN